MNKTTKIVLVIVIALLAMGLIYWGVIHFSQSQTTGKEPVKIGVILPLTGKAANFGQDIKTALDLALEEINQKSNIQLAYQDDECDPKKAISAYQYLHDLERINIFIGSVCSPATLAIAPLAERDKSLLITPASSAYSISDAGDYIFRNHTSDKLEVGELAPYAISKYKKIAIVYDVTNDSLVLNKKYLEEEFKKLGGETVVDISFTGGSSDYKSQLLKLRQSNDIQAVFLSALTNDGIILIREMAELGIKKDILATKTFATSDFVNKVGKNLAEGIAYAEAEYNQETNRNFWDRYVQKSGKNPAIWAPQGYDTLKILAEIVNRCKTADTNCVKDELYKLKEYPGAAGVVSFDASGDAIKKIVIKQIQNGNFVKISN